MGVVYMVKKCTNYLKHMLVYLISFVLNYFIFILVMSFIKNNHIFGIQIANLCAWIVSMLFIFFIDKLFVPDLVNENNSSELHKFILIRILSLIIEVMVLFIFVNVFRFDYFTIKIISLILLFFFNHFYVSRIKLS